jgi:hypothetical protein
LYVPKNEVANYANKVFKIQVVIYMLYAPGKREKVLFRIKMVADQPMGCPLYYPIYIPRF